MQYILKCLTVATRNRTQMSSVSLLQVRIMEVQMNLKFQFNILKVHILPVRGHMVIGFATNFISPNNMETDHFMDFIYTCPGGR